MSSDFKKNLMNRCYFETWSIPLSTECHGFFHCNNVLIEPGAGKIMPHVLLNLDNKVNLKQNLLLPASFSSAYEEKKKKN